MKTLLLLRHAKSSWKDETVADQDRPLNGRGRRAAELIRRFLNSRNLQPDLVLSSSAARTRETVEIIFAGVQRGPDIHYDGGLYLASAAKLLEVISDLPGSPDKVMLVGHNPGIEHLCFRLTGIAERFPTATLASIALPVAAWSEAVNARGELVWLVTPEQLAAF